MSVWRGVDPLMRTASISSRRLQSPPSPPPFSHSPCCLTPTSPSPCSTSLHVVVPPPFAPQSSVSLPYPSPQSSSTTAPSPLLPPSAPLSSRGGHAGLWMTRGGKTPPIPHLPGGSGGCISRTEIGDGRVPRGGGEDWEHRRREAVV